MSDTVLLALIFLGIAFIVVIMMVFINPPEAWLKRVFYGRSQSSNRKKTDR
jgi:hypothetical protein